MTGKIHWRCFHCDATFTRAQERWAREHFGDNQDAKPVCEIRIAGEAALIRVLRDQERQLAGYRSEDGQMMRAWMSRSSEHATALRLEEERGYAKGLADARTPMQAGLERIARWFDEFPGVKGRDGMMITYSAAYGSNGERDYMRAVAIQALDLAGVGIEGVSVFLPRDVAL